MKSCYQALVKILFFLSMLHTCMVFSGEGSLVANIAGWLVLAVLFPIGGIFGVFKSENEDTDSSDDYSGK